MVKLFFQNEAADVPPGTAELMARVAEAACEEEGIDGVSAGVSLTDDAGIRVLNQRMRGIDRATDVLSFPMVRYRAGTAKDNRRALRRELDPETGLAFLGDIVISTERARAQGEEYGHGAAREFAYLTAHALFHLMGYDHEAEAERRVMREMEERVMERVGAARPAASAREGK